MVDNSLSPHGGKLIELALEAKDKAISITEGLEKFPITDQLVKEVINIAYGTFSPLRGFMTCEDLRSVVEKRSLASGYVWPIPIVLDASMKEWNKLGLQEDDSLLLTNQGNPLATIKIEDVFDFDKKLMAKKVFGTEELEHPGVARTLRYKDVFIGGEISLVNPPKMNPPYDRYWYPPKEMRKEFHEKGWKTVIAHQTRNVPHRGHEELMKGAAYFADGVLVNAVIGEKKIGDYVDEIIVEAHATLGEHYFKPNRHMTSILFWDMRYAGPVEAIFHALIRKNLGCTHHMFGRDHAGVGSYYGRYAAHEIFSQIPDLGIRPLLFKEYWYCPRCEDIAYSDICPHEEDKQSFSGTYIRSMITEGREPPSNIFRPEIFASVMRAREKFGSPFVTDEYMRARPPIWTVKPLEP